MLPATESRRGRALRLTRVGIIVVALGVAAAGLWGQTITAAPPPKGLVLTPIGVYRSFHFDGGRSGFRAALLVRRVIVLDLDLCGRAGL
jgi:hypothetical protein